MPDGGPFSSKHGKKDILVQLQTWILVFMKKDSYRKHLKKLHIDMLLRIETKLTFLGQDDPKERKKSSTCAN